MHDYFSHLDINKIPLVHTIYNEVCDCIILDFLLLYSLDCYFVRLQ